MAKATTRKKSPYSVHPSVRYIEHVVAGMKAKTGRTLDEWVAHIVKNGPKTEAERRTWLKTEHKLGTNYCAWLAERSVGKGSDDGDPDAYLLEAETWVETMYAGKKSALRPIFDRLLEIGLSLGDDVTACPCQTMVPLFRQNVFAQIKPTTNTRIDLGLFLRGQKPPKTILPTGGEQKGRPHHPSHPDRVGRPNHCRREKVDEDGVHAIRPQGEVIPASSPRDAGLPFENALASHLKIQN